VAPALLAAFLVTGLIGVASDEIALKPMRRAGALAAAIASIALTIVLENAVRFVFGNDLRGYDLPLFRDWRVPLPSWAFAGGDIRIGPQQLENLALAVAAMTILFLMLAFTRTGKTMRAVADNPTLANLKGINPEAVARLTSFVGMGLAGMGGMLLGLDTSIDPLTGFRAILPVFAAVVVGGLGSIPGAVVGALVVGIGEELSLVLLSPVYKTAVGFAAILIVLTFRPSGLLGARPT
jgi:branched-subunit amino acid ABC-type transport system permease component